MRSRMRIAKGCIAVLVAALAVPTAAQAATATLNTGTLAVTGAGTAETFTVTDVLANVRIVASSAGLADPDGAGTDCSLVDANTVDCLDTVVTAVTINAGAGADTINYNRNDFGFPGDSFTGNGEGDGDILSSALFNGVDGVTTLDGGTGNDTLTGDLQSSPVINGGAGSDTISNPGSGTASGGADGDTMTSSGQGISSGGDGNDQMTKASGFGAVNGDAGADTITVNDNASGIVSGGADDDLITTAGDAAINGNAGADKITLDPGSNGTVDAGSENDLITDNRPDYGTSINAGDGDDTVNGLGGSVNGGAGNDTLNAGNSQFSGDTGGDGNDTLNGSNKAGDQFVSEPGADSYTGGTTERPPQFTAGDVFLQSYGFGYCDEFDCYGAGGDSMRYVGDPAVKVTLNGVADDGAAGEGDNVRADIESIIGGNGNDVLDASSATTEPKSLSGGRGDDTLIGGAHNDSLSGGNGSDTLNGGAGDDSFDGAESINPDGAANDQAGNDTYNGGEGDDAFDASSSMSTSKPPASKVTQSGSGLGADTFNGGPGVDSIYVSRTTYVPREPNEADPSPTQRTDVPVSVTLDGVANDGAPGFALTIVDIEDVSTGAGADTIIGNAASNVLSGGGGNDTIDGGTGVDLLYGDNGVDKITSRDGGFDKVNCGLAVDLPVQGDVGDELRGCEGTAALAALAPPADTTKPTMKLSGAATIKAKAFSKKPVISVTVTPSEPALFEAELFAAGGRIAKTGQVSLGTAKLGLQAGKRTLKIKVSKTNAKAIVKKARSKKFAKKGYALTVAVLETDAAGLSSKSSTTVRIKK